MKPSPDYCPFCGARLRDDESLEHHLDDRDECRERFDAWRPERTPSSEPRSGFTPLHGLLLAVIVLAVMGYSLLIVQQILLGLLASSIVVVAFVVGSRY
ncbi:DUF7501 family protein [Halorarius litoreus]|uniref:DUF7501 family protein n=1 Tax=Halorarius litoreus TaxID=2962676 RepID=UPI0020CE3C58|nr:hypothetical protein [Halorarius litoreus]